MSGQRCELHELHELHKLHERCELRKLREAQLYANEQRRDTADLDSKDGKNAEKCRTRGKTMEEKLIIAGTDV